MFRFCFCLAMLSLQAGCRSWLKEEKLGATPLHSAAPSADGAALEVFLVRFPLGDSGVNGPLWDEIDEQSFADATRRQLDRHGFRAGLVRGAIPERLASLLELTDAPSNAESLWQEVDVRTEPTVTRQIVHVPKESEARILSSSTIFEEAYVMRSHAGGLGGETLHSAQGVLKVRAQSGANGGAAIEITPELHHSHPKQEIRFDNGVGRFSFSRPKEVFEDLAIRSELSPGEMLILSMNPDREGSLAQYFFRENSSRGCDQKMVILRLARAPVFELYDESATDP